MASEYRMTHVVEFADTDMAGIMHFANFFRYMEVTEHAFLRSLGLSVHMEVEGQVIGLPRVQAHCDYRRPLKYEDRVEVHLVVREKREKSLRYEFVFRKEGSDEEVARGGLTVVCVSVGRSGGGGMQAVPLPALMAERVQAAVGETGGA